LIVELVKALFEHALLGGYSCCQHRTPGADETPARATHPRNRGPASSGQQIDAIKAKRRKKVPALQEPNLLELRGRCCFPVRK
jgi:hypothetical protein